MGRGHGSSRGGGGASGAGRDGRSAGLTKALEAAEASMRSQIAENSYIFDEQGNEVYRSGRESNQQMSSNPKLNALMNRTYNTHRQTSLDASKVPNNIITHNHPSNGSFSTDDLHAALDHNAKEIRAVGPTRTYSLRRGKNGWGVDGRTVGMEYGRIKAEMGKADARYVARYKGDKKAAQRRVDATRAHRIMKQVSKQFGLDYTYSRAQ